MIRVGIIGAAGYVGATSLKLVHNHPKLTISYVGSSTYKDQLVSSIYSFVDDKTLVFSKFDPSEPPDVDCLILALPHGHSHQFMQTLLSKTQALILDMAADFRLDDATVFQDYYHVAHDNPDLLTSFSYGIPELFLDDINEKPHCALPGCFATAMILGLYPLCHQGIVQSVIVDGKTGISGAGKKPVIDNLFCEINESVKPYSTFNHRHIAEVGQFIDFPVMFSPHIVPMSTGILCSHYITCTESVSLEKILNVYDDFYAHSNFIYRSDIPVKTKDVLGTNRCGIYLVKQDAYVAVFVVLDNLMKGAASQAIQVLNIKMGWHETLGLDR